MFVTVRISAYQRAFSNFLFYFWGPTLIFVEECEEVSTSLPGFFSSTFFGDFLGQTSPK